jgi:hypothetical protein
MDAVPASLEEARNHVINGLAVLAGPAGVLLRDLEPYLLDQYGPGDYRVAVSDLYIDGYIETVPAAPLAKRVFGLGQLSLPLHLSLTGDTLADELSDAYAFYLSRAPRGRVSGLA